MNKKTEQINVCKAMLDSSRSVAYCELPDDMIAVTPDGFYCFIFTKKEIIFDYKKLRKYDFTSALKENDKQEQLTYTGITIECGLRNDTLVKLKGNTFESYARKSLYEKFKAYNLFAESPMGAIIAKDDFGQQVGLFLPMHYHEKEET